MSKALFARRFFLATCLLGLAGCTIQQTEVPDLAGPSEFAQSFTVVATPDAISQDGGSTSTVLISASDAAGRPRSLASFRLDTFVGDTPVDYGTLSARTVVTGTNGIAAVTYTAPPALPAGSDVPICHNLPGNCVTIVATAISTDFAGSHTQSVNIRLLPLGVILPPGGTPIASFSFSPAGPTANTPVTFDATGSCADSSGTCSSVGLSYSWDFGDGGTATGKTPSHSFGTARTYSVTLTVTNDRSRTASLTKTITVGEGVRPTATFIFSPTPVVVGREVFFDASSSRAGAGHRIVTYKWSWGDGFGSPDRSVPTEDHDWDVPGVYQVVLTVTDEAGQTGTATQAITVIAGAPIADFTAVVSNPAAHTVALTSTSTAVGSGVTFTDYGWDFGDSTQGSGPTTSHSYAAAGTYPVRLTVTDSNGRTAFVTKSVTVP